MSRFSILKSIAVISFGAVLGYNTVDYFKNKNSGHRYLASMTMSKIAAQQFAKTLIDVRIKNSTVAVDEDDSSTITVTLTAYKPIPAGLAYTWNLPNDVHVIEGQVNGLLPDLAANQSQDLVLKVKGYNKQKKSYISFAINGDVENMKIQREVLASSRPEDSFEYVVQNFEKSKANENKLAGKVGKNDFKAPIDPKKIVH